MTHSRNIDAGSGSHGLRPRRFADLSIARRALQWCRARKRAAVWQSTAGWSGQLLDYKQDLQDRDDELAAARAANRDLITTLNRPVR